MSRASRDGDFEKRCNLSMVELEALNEQDAELLHTLIQRHQQFTDSTVAHRILSRWGDYSHRFVKVMPTEYRKVIARQHLDSDAARLASV